MVKLRIRPGGAIELEGRAVVSGNVKEEVARAAAGGAVACLVVGGGDTPFAAVLDAVEACKGAGLKAKVSEAK